MRKLDLELGNTYIVGDILVPRAYDPSGLRQESRALGASKATLQIY